MVTLLKTIFGDIFFAAIIAGLITYVGINYFIKIMNRIGIVPIMSYSGLFKMFKVIFVICITITLFNSCQDYTKHRKETSQIESTYKANQVNSQNLNTNIII